MLLLALHAPDNVFYTTHRFRHHVSSENRWLGTKMAAHYIICE